MLITCEINYKKKVHLIGTNDRLLWHVYCHCIVIKILIISYRSDKYRSSYLSTSIDDFTVEMHIFMIVSWYEKLLELLEDTSFICTAKINICVSVYI